MLIYVGIEHECGNNILDTTTSHARILHLQMCHILGEIFLCRAYILLAPPEF